MANLPEPNFFEHLWDVVKIIFVGLLALFGFNVKKELKRVDKLEENSVKLEIFNATLKALRDDFKELSHNVRDDLREINRKIDTQKQDRR